MSNLELVKILWDYMYLNMAIKPCDCILGLGCDDLSIPKRCVELYNDGYADIIIFSGGKGKCTENWEKTEAEKFCEIAVSLGIPRDKILLENASTNTGDNFNFTKQMLEAKNLDINSFLIVQKPYMERRCYATFKKVFFDKECYVTSTKTDMDEYFKLYIELHGSDEELINILVGDVQRIKVYAKKGWQIEQYMPNSVWNAYLELVKRGYNKYIVK